MGRGPGEGASRPRGRAPVRRHRDRRADHTPNVSLRPLRREPGGDRARQGVLHLPRIRDTPAVRREQRQRVPGRLRARPRRNLVIHGASVPRSRRRRRRPRVGRDARRDGGHGHRVRGVRRDARDDRRGAGGVPRPGRGAFETRNLPRRLRRRPKPPGGRVRRGAGRLRRDPRAIPFVVSPRRPGRLRGRRRVDADPVRLVARVVLRGDGVRESKTGRRGSGGASRGDAALDVQRVPGGRRRDGGDGERVQARGSGDDEAGTQEDRGERRNRSGHGSGRNRRI
mmetsp:Transcript_6994/g.31603  ORF Transcript_6994/g.31603 Transcript_6994/m.31603 type:complete len:283 (-) Transcript_6994:524-1372(-)